MKKTSKIKKTSKNHPFFTKHELKNLEKLRKYLNSETKELTQEDIKWIEFANLSMPVILEKDKQVLFKKFTETGDYNIILDMISNEGLIESFFLKKIIYLARRKYSESIYEDDKDTGKLIDKFFQDLARALRGRYRKPSKLSLLHYRLESYLDEQEEYKWDLGVHTHIFIDKIYNRYKAEVGRGYANQIKKSQNERNEVKKKIKTLKNKASSIDTAILKEIDYLNKKALPSLNDKISKLRERQKSSGHKEAKTRTLDELYKITQVKIAPRNFDKLLSYVNKVMEEMKSEGMGDGVIIPWEYGPR